jgi:signal transduction histidine kinase
VKTRRLDDRIRELCTRVIEADDPNWDRTIRELQSALQEMMLRVRNLTAAATVAGRPDIIHERRGRKVQ